MVHSKSPSEKASWPKQISLPQSSYQMLLVFWGGGVLSEAGEVCWRQRFDSTQRTLHAHGKEAMLMCLPEVGTASRKPSWARVDNHSLSWSQYQKDDQLGVRQYYHRIPTLAWPSGIHFTKGPGFT